MQTWAFFCLALPASATFLRAYCIFLSPEKFLQCYFFITTKRQVSQSPGMHRSDSNSHIWMNFLSFFSWKCFSFLHFYLILFLNNVFKYFFYCSYLNFYWGAQWEPSFFEAFNLFFKYCFFFVKVDYMNLESIIFHFILDLIPWFL